VRGTPDFFAAIRQPQAGRETEGRLADPSDPQTFERSKLDWSQWDRNPEVIALHRDLIRLRREDPVFASQRADRIHAR